MLNKRRSFGTRKVTPPQPICMSEAQKDLRKNRPIRPAGSRPLPSKPVQASAKPVENTSVPISGALHKIPDVNEQPSGKRYSFPAAATFASSKGRPLVQAPGDRRIERRVTPPELRYRDSAARAQEKQEAHLIRKALEERDFQDEESRVYRAAQLEAADLVWKHRNPELADAEITAPYRNPDLPRKKYVIQLEGSTLDRVGNGNQQQQSMASAVVPLRVGKRSSTADAGNKGPVALHSSRRRSSAARKVSTGSNRGAFRNPDDQIYEEPSEIVITDDVEAGSKPPLQPTMFHNNIRGARPLPEKPGQTAHQILTPINRVDIYKNPPTQSRDAAYRINQSSRSSTPEGIETPHAQSMEIRSDDIRAATSMRRSDRSPKLPNPTAVSDQAGRPIVSFDPAWKPDTNSRGASLDMERPSSRPPPTKRSMISPRGSIAEVRSSSRTSTFRPSNQLHSKGLPLVDAPTTDPVPTIVIPNEHKVELGNSCAIPEIHIQQDSCVEEPSHLMIQVVDQSRRTTTAPAICVASEQNSKQSTRPLPPPSKNPVNRASWLSRGRNIPTISGDTRGPTVSCTACGLPIAGRVVTASGAISNQKARFHAECFTCFHCNTALECVSFYPEPEAARLERLGNAGSDNDSLEQQRLPSPDETDLRFYCHLDFHDLFSPRCGSCHTPIEGAVILAAGKSWHEGHFFCAECGDPFSSASPFIESKGYAYCVGCHTKRTAARCRACKKQILDDVSVEALGAKWHEECFRCDECEGNFGEDGCFFVREIQIELTEKEKRKGVLQSKVEERAVCEGCEQRRLKSPDVAAFL